VRTGWSVTVVGPSRVISDPEQVASLAGLPVSARPPDSSRCYISVKLGLIRGWRMAPSPGDAEPAARDGSPEAQV
jgi:uncharacterized protein